LVLRALAATFNLGFLVAVGILLLGDRIWWPLTPAPEEPAPEPAAAG
jgi:hypothetical protein